MHSNDSSEKLPKSFWFLKLILSLFLLMLILVLLIPYYNIKINPQPSDITSKDIGLDEMLNQNLTFPNGDRTITSQSDLNKFVTANNVLIKSIADKIVVRACSSPSQSCQAKALFYFVRNNFVYISDPVYTEYVKYPLETMINGGGDCDDLAVLTASLIQSIGIQTEFVFVPEHVYLKIYLPEEDSINSENGWFYADPTCSNCNFGEKVK